MGNIDTFPGADMPFGMVQWSPDTTPDRTSGGGYAYQDSAISGFSLTHLSGPGLPRVRRHPDAPDRGGDRQRPGCRPARRSRIAPRWRAQGATPSPWATPGTRRAGRDGPGRARPLRLPGNGAGQRAVQSGGQRGGVGRVGRAGRG